MEAGISASLPKANGIGCGKVRITIVSGKFNFPDFEQVVEIKNR
jgi:hypothetical protein